MVLKSPSGVFSMSVRRLIICRSSVVLAEVDLAPNPSLPEFADDQRDFASHTITRT